MKKFRKSLPVMAANGASLRAGYNYADTAELFRVQHTVAPAQLPKGRYRRVTGNEAAALGLVAAAAQVQAARWSMPAIPSRPPARSCTSCRSTRNTTCARSRPRTKSPPASPPSALSFGGAIGATGTSGPGPGPEGRRPGPGRDDRIADGGRRRAAGRARAPGMPTKTEQSDLLMAIHGRHGDCPAGRAGRGHARRLLFAMAFEAVRLATKYMTPVMVLSDSFLANGAEPWRIVDPDDLPELRARRNCPPARVSPLTGAIRRRWPGPG